MDIAAAEYLAKALIRKYLPHGLWEFRWDDSRYHFGSCGFRQHVDINGVTYPTPGGIITLSRVLVAINADSETYDTVLHEIAHALCGPNVNHGKIWKKTARKLGCRAESCCDTSRVKLPPGKYIAECPKCGMQREYDKKRSISCGRCDNKFNPEYRMVFRENPEAIQSHPDKNPMAQMNTPTELNLGNTEVGNS